MNYGDVFMAYRTHTCGELRGSAKGETVKLAGWVDTVRDHGGILFIDLRDRFGTTQVIFDPDDSKESWDIAQHVRSEYVIEIEGTVDPRPDDMVNTSLPSGEIEVRANKITVLNRSKTPPFPLDDEKADKVFRIGCLRGLVVCDVRRIRRPRAVCGILF